ncbi:MAG: formate--tetrahydrofolate ligase [Clostridia bacterium]|nr:formate--tetrahydrofolate ligase [Clostridia bacterium]
MSVVPSDINIAQSAELHPIERIAAGLGLARGDLELYGEYKAKISFDAIARAASRPEGRLVLVTAMTPTPSGEGKTTTTVGLGDALRHIGKNPVIALREPSLGPVFGIKGGAAGGGYAQVVPMEDINLHFTGDLHAVGAANNLLAAMIDNHIYQGNTLGIDSRRIVWRRCMDMNDRQLRFLTDGLGGRINGVPREDGFDITVASEVMAVLCLADGIEDLKARLGRMVVAYTFDDRPVTTAQIKADGAMTALLRDAVKPNLVQTLEHTPALIHGGPFANIAHGCNSLTATRLAMRLGDYAITEAGFGADLGAEKFIDIKCRAAGLRPDAAVIVATIRALKHHGGVPRDRLADEDADAVSRGLPNLLRHIKNMVQGFGVPSVVAVNRFPTDTEEEFERVREACEAAGVRAVWSEVWARGGEGGDELANEVVRLAESGTAERSFRFAYELDRSLEGKITTLAWDIYGAGGVEFAPAAQKDLKRFHDLGYGGLPVCMAKTQYSFTDDASKVCAPSGFALTVRAVRLSAGAGFVVALAGDIMTMPGLPKTPGAERIDVDASGRITGLF